MSCSDIDNRLRRMGGAYNHNKAFGPTVFPHQRKIGSEGIFYIGPNILYAKVNSLQ